MRLLLDTCVWGGARDALRAGGHDVVWGGEWDQDPGDQAILLMARNQGRVLVTLDKDFGELAVVHRIPHCGIVRVVGFSAREHARVVEHVLALHGRDLETGAIITAEPGRLRIRPADRADV